MTKKNLSSAKRALLEKWLQGDLNEEKANISRRPPKITIPLSFPQQRQLFLELLERETAVNNLSVLLEIKGKLDLSALEKSANQIIERHDILRTSYSFGPGLPTCNVVDNLRINIPLVDMHQLQGRDQIIKARQLAEKEVLVPFDLTKAPLIRLKIYCLDHEKYLLLVIIHHTIADGWSLGVFLQELMLFYNKFTVGNSLQLPELPIQYADFAYWQTNDQLKEALQSSMAYWKNQLGGELSVLELPVDYKRGAKQTFSGNTHRFVLTRELSEGLEKLSREEGVTVFMTLLTAFYILLHRYSGQDEILVGTPIANRNLPELEPMIGIFINTLALRVNLSGEPGFRKLLKQVGDVSLEAYAHQDLPFEKLVESLRPKRDLSRAPIFQTVFNLQNSPLPNLAIPGLEILFREIDRGVSQFDLTLMMSKTEGQYLGTVEYNDGLFKPATIARMFRSFQLLLAEAVANPDIPISRLPIINKEEKHQLVYNLNRTHLEIPRKKGVHQLFEERVEQTPDAIAVIYDEVQFTYNELDQRTNVLARHLQTLGVGREIRVGILMDKSLNIVEAMLGVLKAGGTYVPLHTSFPKERVQFMLEDADVRVLLTNVDNGLPDDFKGLIVHLNDFDFSTKSDSSDPPKKVTLDNSAYIIYTSGSTGYPKGVMVEHFALVNFLWSMRNRPGIKKNDVLLSVTSISFDIAVLELFLPLITGGTVVIPGKEVIKNPVLLGRKIQDYNVNIMQATPATWQLLLETGWKGKPGLKALCGGDVLTRTLADRLLDRVGSLWNMYGPTETTVWSSVNQIKKGNAPVTIGQPIGNTQLYILDGYLQPVPIGVVGELHIGGEGLARGYLNRNQLTREKFIPDPFASRAGARLYKTGDLARYLPDYSIEILGRLDDQLKIQGNRIELGEISSVLLQHPSLHDGIVICRTENSGEKQLVGYFVPIHDGSPDSWELREFLRKKLPGYMIPSFFVSMDSLPLTPHGKIDREALPIPEDVLQLPGYIAPRNEVEEMLSAIWQDVLDIDQVGVYDNFFELGGASMQSLQIVAKANMFGYPITVENIFEYQTIAELAAQVDGKLQ